MEIILVGALLIGIFAVIVYNPKSNNLED